MTMVKSMIQYAISTFKARCLGLVQYVHDTGEELTITKRGKPIARLVPVRDAASQIPFDAMAGSADELGDIVSALPDEDWGRLA